MKLWLWLLLPSIAFAAKLNPVLLIELHPSQFAVGFRALSDKLGEVKAVEGNAKQLEAYLKKNAFPIVLGPNRRRYLQDGHHTGLALRQRGVKQAYYSVSEDWSSLAESDFQRKMVDEKRVYLRDAAGKPRPMSELPATLDQLADDAYRSVAFFVKERGGFRKSKEPFAEFQWAEFFRPRVPVGTSDAAFEAAVLSAMKWARRPEAAHLPGYIP